jgi:hypothetical protein
MVPVWLNGQKNGAVGARMSEKTPGRGLRRALWDGRSVRLCAILIAIPALQSTPSLAQTQDQAQASLLVGTWEATSALATQIDNDQRISGFFYTEEFHSDGTGLFNIYMDKVCGRLVAAHSFRWNISQGNLISRATYPKKLSADKIISLNRSNVTFRSQSGGQTMCRHKITECPTS